jgi:hypothetical protein
LEGQVESLEIDLGKLQSDLDAADEYLHRVRRELDAQKAKNAGLLQEGAAQREKRASLEDRLRRLREKFNRPVPAKVQTTWPPAVQAPEVKQGLSQMVIQWVGPSANKVSRGEVIQNSGAGISPKKIGGWNAQRSKDGYYRLYRKIKGRVYSIYIGKELDIDKAGRRIAEKEKELLGLNSAVAP